MANEITFLDFTASWCAPCQQMKPLIKQFKKEHPDVIVREINVETTSGGDEADQFRVQAIPTMIMLVDGKSVWRKTGAVGAKALANGLAKAREAVAALPPSEG